MTNRQHPNPTRVLAIDPTSRGFGFVVLEAPARLVDWGGKSIAHQDEGKTLEKVSKLIEHYRPEIVVFENPDGSRRCVRVRHLLTAVGRLATGEGLKSRSVSNAQVKRVFRAFHAVTKHEIALAVAKQLPDLAPQLPKQRKAWTSEGSQMQIFDAAAFALTYIHLRLLRQGETRAPSPSDSAAAGIPNPS